MKVYKHGSKEQETILHVQPGKDFPDVEGWMMEERNEETGVMQKKATMFAIKFQRGVADVSSNLGKYLLDKGYAEREPRPVDYQDSDSALQYNSTDAARTHIQLPT